MSQYSQTTKQQVEALERTFSTTIENDYKKAFIHCKTNKDTAQCDLMQNKLAIVKNSLAQLQSLDAVVASKVDKNKNAILTDKTILANKKKLYSANMSVLNTVNDVNQAAKPLKMQKKKNMTSKYLYLAYYVLVDIIILYLLHKQYNFSGFYFIAVFLVILIMIFILGFLGIPYS